MQAGKTRLHLLYYLSYTATDNQRIILIQERALVYINREGFTDKTYCLWWNHFGVWLDA